MRLREDGSSQHQGGAKEHLDAVGRVLRGYACTSTRWVYLYWGHDFGYMPYDVDNISRTTASSYPPPRIPSRPQRKAPEGHAPLACFAQTWFWLMLLVPPVCSCASSPGACLFVKAFDGRTSRFKLPLANYNPPRTIVAVARGPQGHSWLCLLQLVGSSILCASVGKATLSAPKHTPGRSLYSYSPRPELGSRGDSAHGRSQRATCMIGRKRWCGPTRLFPRPLRDCSPRPVPMSEADASISKVPGRAGLRVIAD